MLLEDIILPVGDMCMGSSIKKEMKRIEKEISGSEAQILSIQKGKLERVLNHAAANSAYYKELVTQPNGSSPYEFLKQFPILEKEVVRNRCQDIIADNSQKLFAQKSSGSSGFQTKVYWSYDEFSPYRATGLIWWKWAGYNIGDCLLQTGINTNRGFVKSVKDTIFRTYYLQAFDHRKEELTSALKWLKKKKDPVVGGYASSLYILACHAEEIGCTIKLKTCISWGDKLFDHYKTKIETIFQTKVHQNYGSSEGFLMASQKDLDYMYIMSTNVYLEIVDDNGNEVEDGELGHVVVTNLNNYAMPMIRYRIGDLAIKLPKDQYPAHRELNLPLLQKVVGRDTDIVKTKNGNKLVVHSFTGVFEHYQEIKQYQILQENLEGITIKYIPGPGLSDEMIERIQKKLLEMVGDDQFVINMQKVDHIKASPSGKPQMIISKLPRS